MHAIIHCKYCVWVAFLVHNMHRGAGDHDDRKSTSGYIFKSASGAILWRSKKQDCIALSTAEAEYVALSSATQEAVWLRKLATDLGNPPKESTTIHEDKQSAIAMSKNPQFHGRAKHIDIKHHYVREQVNSGSVKLVYCPTNEMTADIFTKGLGREQFCWLRGKAGIVHMDKCVQVDKWGGVLKLCCSYTCNLTTIHRIAYYYYWRAKRAQCLVMSIEILRYVGMFIFRNRYVVTKLLEDETSIAEKKQAMHPLLF